MNDQRRSNQERKLPPKTANTSNAPRSPQNGQRPARPPQRPMANGARPTPSGQRPQTNGTRPMPNGQRPRPQQPPQARRPEPQSKPSKQPTPPPRRRNEESYVFSRSLSETQDRILTERRERLEDAKKFRREDVKEKTIKGIIAFTATFLVLAIIATIVVSCSLNAGKLKKSKGEFIYKIGTKSTELAYKDAVQNNAIYISMNSVSELCELTLSGDIGNEIRFYTSEGTARGSYIAFSKGSRTANINGYGMEMPAPSKINGTECAVPIDFLSTVMGGIEIKVDRQKNEITVTRNELPDSTPLEPRYEDVSFMLKTNGALSSLNENKYFAGKPIFEFKNDLSEYEQYMNPTDSKRDAYLMLLNKETPCDEDFKPSDLDNIPAKWVNPDKSSYITLELDATAIKALEAMMLEMRSEGFGNIFVTSAYRSYSYQSSLYNTYIDNEMSANPSLSYEEAQAIVETYSAVPGYSEHHTGLCVDFITTDMGELTNEFAEKEVYDWLCANAWKFGFILRYPEDKVDVTGYSYESWHWRFVGRSHALKVLQSGKSFDEYMASMPQR